MPIDEGSGTVGVRGRLLGTRSPTTTGSSRSQMAQTAGIRRLAFLNAFAGFSSHFLIPPFDRKTTVECERAVDRRVTPAAGDPLAPLPHHSRRNRFILELRESREIHRRLDPVKGGVSGGEIVRLSIRRSRRPEALPWALPPETCPMAQRAIGQFF